MRRLMAPRGLGESPGKRIRQKHQEYYDAGVRYRFLYYSTRIIGGLAAGILPFVVYPSPAVATGLSIVIVVMTVVDTVFAPKENWKTNSRASDLLYIADLKKDGKYKEYKEQLDIILSKEDQQMLQLLGLDEVIKKAKNTAQGKAD